VGLFTMLEKEFLPAPENSKFEISGNTIPAYGFDETNRVSNEIERTLLELPGVESVFSESGAVSKEAGRSEDISVNSIHYIVKCTDPETRARAMNDARAILAKSELLDFSLYLEKNTLSEYLATGGDNFQVKVFYENIEQGKIAVNQVLAAIKDFDNLNDIKTTTTEGKPTFTIRFKQDLLNELKISRDVISNFINQAVRGEKAGEVRLVQKNYDIYVRIRMEEEVIAMRRLLGLSLAIGDKTYFLKDLVEISVRPSVKRIEKERQNMFFLISADAPGDSLDEMIAITEQKLESIDFPPNTRAVIAGEEEERRRAFDSLNQALWLAVILVYMIMAAQFENIVQPLIILFTVPMGFIGAFLFLLISGNTLNIISGIGLMVLVGIGVNDAIVKVEYANQLRREGRGVRDAVMTASRVRLRPILMTTFTTVCGVLPMALMRQAGSELQRPLALVVMGGLLFTTFLTLLLIPVFFEVLENHKEKRAKKKAEKNTTQGNLRTVPVKE
ncbi:MAG: efflux RND transporter permease subunit, partial [bacterium]|nr:efflux RND transporter permease subunit [bacterium]